ncbi:MAG: MBOAT family O-acyltransferase [Longicatena sp.]
MAFNSIIFLWYFFPCSMLLYYIVPRKLKNTVLVLISLVFYAWGGANIKHTAFLIAIILANYVGGILLEKFKSKQIRRIILIIGIISNLSFLIVFKYLDFIIIKFNLLLGTEFSALNLIMPLGVSFFVFQILTYIIDVFLEKVPAQHNLINLALYITFFPKLIMGPIVKYRDMEPQLSCRSITKEKFAYGIKRFIYGLSKKIMIADVLAITANKIFSYDLNILTTPTIIMGVILYSFQLYFDFSGYSDMAIGLAKMYGFDFMENFNYPYISQSVKEFWRRWHISLSSWFRDYVYIPLGGNRKGHYRTYLNLLIIFLLTGIWHGASFNFWLWGLFHGFFMLMERAFLGKILEKNKFKIINIIYTISVVFVGWAIFRCTNLQEALYLVKNMFIIHPDALLNLSFFMTNKAWITLIVAVLLCGVIQQKFKNLHEMVFSEKISNFEMVMQFLLLAYCLLYAVTGTYSAFIYFKF